MDSPSLTSGSLPLHIRRIALPMSIGYFFNTMYNVVDSFYAGRISTEALAAMALSFPLFFIIVAISGGLARGASALIANAIGAKDKDLEATLSGQVFSLACVCALAVSIFGLSTATPLFKMLGASDNYLSLATSYTTPLFIGAVFFLLSSMSNAILLAHGDSKTYSRVLIIGFFLNLILDPWFLYGGFGLPAMGIKGIACATVLIQAIGGFYLFSVVVRRGHVTLRCTEHLKPKLKTYGQILRQGIPTSFNLMSIAMGFFVTTYFLKFYGEGAVAAFGVGTRIEQMALLPAIGLGSAIVSIVGQNNGAGEIERVRECVRLCFKYGLYLIITASVLLFVFATPLVQLFTEDSEVIETGTRYVRIVSFIQWAYVAGFIYIGFLQAMKRPMYGFAEALTRKVILPLVVFSLVVHFFQLSLEGFWMAMCAINIVMAGITISYGQSVLRRLC
ncbi:MAG: MATE family efflux transporter [Rubritalea sp.]|uniref:MATE family efflux transporter n=1 Tax=Rubritalea sp. TaxID=2109375 RepID=UPI00324244B4